jgi:hypothetical protein
VEENYKNVEKGLTTMINAFFREPGGDKQRKLLQDARAIIARRGSSANQRATVEATIIRSALLLSEDQNFAQSLCGILAASGRYTGNDISKVIQSLLTTHEARQSAKSDSSQLLRTAESDLQEYVASGTPPQCGMPQVDLTNCRTFDFFFTVLEMGNMKGIFEQAFGDLVNAMKCLERRKNPDDSEVSDVESEAENTVQNIGTLGGQLLPGTLGGQSKAGMLGDQLQAGAANRHEICLVEA